MFQDVVRTGRVRQNGGGSTLNPAVTVGQGTGHGAILAPGEVKSASAPLTIQSSLLVNSDATLLIQMNSNRSSAATVVSAGVTINNAQFSIVDTGNTALPTGIAFTVINNTAATRISGTFENLPNGGTIIAGSNTFQANYEGGDGNDLTLTVVP